MKVLDLFAGSGAMGIEALSRGASRAVFIESSPAVTEVIKANLRACAFTDSAQVMVGKLPGALKRIIRKEGSFDLIFIDPPYEEGLAIETLVVLAGMEMTAPEGLVVVEHSSKEEMPEEIKPLRKIRIKKYGSTAVSIYERKTLENG
jgi:16S rRNA (guanine(966)-N(2))-methyltransferase RsmD